MKKLLLLVTMACSLGFFASCSSDDDNKSSETETVWKTFKGGDYNVWGDFLDTADNLLTYKLLDLKASVTKAGDNTAKVTLLSQAQYDTISISVPEAAIAASDGYTLSGKGTMIVSATDEATGKYQKVTKDVTLTAKITSDNSDITADVKFDNTTLSFSNAAKPELSKLMGTWYVTPAAWYDESGKEVEAGDASAVYADGSFKFNWTTKEGTVISLGDTQLPAANAALLAERMANQSLDKVLSSVAFTRGGKIIARYRSASDAGDDTKWQIAEGYATYRTMTGVDNLIYVVLNKEKILAGVTDATQKAALTTIIDAFDGDIPVNIDWGKDGSAFFYLNEDLVEGLSTEDTIVNFVKNLKDEDLNGMGGMIKLLFAQVPSLLDNTTELKVGLELAN